MQKKPNFIHPLLQNCNSTADVASALHTLCGTFGDIQKLEIIKTPDVPASSAAVQKCARANGAGGAGRSRGRAMCFLRMASGQQEEELLRHVGPDASQGRFGGNVVLVVELNAAIQPPGEPSANGGCTRA